MGAKDETFEAAWKAEQARIKKELGDTEESMRKSFTAGWNAREKALKAEVEESREILNKKTERSEATVEAKA